MKSAPFTLPTGLAELATALEHGQAADQTGARASWADRSEALWASGTVVMDRHVLLKSVEKLDGDLKSMREEHATKYAAAQKAEKDVAAAIDRGESVTPDTDLFKSMDEAGKAASELEDKISAQEVVKARLVQQMGAAGIQPAGEGNEDRDGYMSMLRELRGAIADGQGSRPTPGLRLTQGELYTQAQQSGRLTQQEYGQRIPIGEAMNRDELKSALITGADAGSAGAFVQPTRIGYFPLPLRPLTILDLITIGQTDSDLIEYIRMLSLTNAAATVPEAISTADVGGGAGQVTAIQGGLKPESAMAFEIVQEAVSTLAHWVPATKRALADAGQLRTIIDGALRWGLGDVVERQVVAGNGVGDNLLGILEQTGMNAIAAGTASHADKIHMAKTQIRLDGYLASGVLINPLDGETIWLSRDGSGGTANSGAYLFGNPNQMGPRTLWGMPVAESPAVPQGTAIVGALEAAILWLREGTQIMASDSHKDWFTRNMVAILAEMRAGFGIPTPAAFCEVNLAAS